jgi:hypothetical protein
VRARRRGTRGEDPALPRRRFTEVALVQIGGDQQEPFPRWAQDELLPALRAL